MRDLLVITAVALGTYALRASMLVGLPGTRSLPDAVRRGLTHLSPALLAALVAPAFLVPRGAIAVEPAPLTAAVVGMAVARRTGSIPAVLAAGVLAHELVRWLL